jgi:DNA-binding response OmpR family regulator
MIVIATNSVREASLLTALCEHRSWPAQACATIAEFVKIAEKNTPRIVVTRHRLGDGYSDDLFEWFKVSSDLAKPRVVVLVPADCSIRHEARQVALGGDIVMRDPLRLEVLLEYLTKYRSRNSQAPALASPPLTYDFAGVRVVPHEHRLERSGKTVRVAPQVIALLRLLHHSIGKVASYPTLYCELFNQRFAGDTSNCRVLLGKATASFAPLRVDLRAHVKVIPKSGYLYTPMAAPVRTTKNIGKRA